MQQRGRVSTTRASYAGMSTSNESMTTSWLSHQLAWLRDKRMRWATSAEGEAADDASDLDEACLTDASSDEDEQVPSTDADEPGFLRAQRLAAALAKYPIGVWKSTSQFDLEPDPGRRHDARRPEDCPDNADWTELWHERGAVIRTREITRPSAQAAHDMAASRKLLEKLGVIKAYGKRRILALNIGWHSREGGGREGGEGQGGADGDDDEEAAGRRYTSSLGDADTARALGQDELLSSSPVACTKELVPIDHEACQFECVQELIAKIAPAAEHLGAALRETDGTRTELAPARLPPSPPP